MKRVHIPLLVALVLLTSCTDPGPHPRKSSLGIALDASRTSGEATYQTVVTAAVEAQPGEEALRFEWRLNGELLDVGGPTVALDVAEAGSHVVSVRAESPTARGAASLTITAVDEYRPTDAPDVLIMGYAGRCVVLCVPPDGNRNYLPEDGTLVALEEAFAGLGFTAESISFRSHLLDSDARGFGYTFSQTFLDAVVDGWVSGFRDPTRLVLAAHSHGNQFMSLLAFDNPDVTFDWAIYLDAICTFWEADHLIGLPGWFEAVYGDRRNYPSPLNSINACDSFAVPGLRELQDISDVVPNNITYALEVGSHGEAFGLVRDNDPNVRTDGSYGLSEGLAGVHVTDETHTAVHRAGSTSMQWVQDVIRLNGLPPHPSAANDAPERGSAFRGPAALQVVSPPLGLDFIK